MIKAKHHLLVYSFFRWYAHVKMKSHFNSVKIEENIDVSNNAVLLIANHISWWDGFWCLFLSTTIFKKKFYFMMLEKELRKRWLFSYSGGFSVPHGGRSMLESINYTADILLDKKNLVLMFPQGKMHSMYNDQVKFQKGIEKIIEKTTVKPKLVFMVSMTEYFEHQKPDIYFHMKEFDNTDYSVAEIEKAYNSFYKTCITKHKNLYL